MWPTVSIGFWVIMVHSVISVPGPAYRLLYDALVLWVTGVSCPFGFSHYLVIWPREERYMVQSEGGDLSGEPPNVLEIPVCTYVCTYT